ncbi:MAG: molecular chaperone DnaJ [Candidatus Woesearchaeota archaeon]
MAEKDYYKVLGLGRNSTKEEIKKAYKNLAKKYHPDINKTDSNATEKFKEINEAAAVLADDQKRSQYDQFGSAEGFQGFDMSGFDFTDFMHGSFDFEDIFDSFFSRGFGFGDARAGQQEQGSHLRFDLEITLEEAAFGTTKKIIIPKTEACDACNGTGAESESGIRTCTACKGSGAQRVTQRTPFGIFSTTTVCKACGGTGQEIDEPCRTCHGEGVVKANKRLEVKIPAGVEDGSRLRIKNEGDAGGRGAHPGDLYVIIRVKPHRTFERKGNDIFVDVPITFVQAALGAEIEVPTLKSKATLKIPPGTQAGTVFRMRGDGIPNLHGFGTGSQNVRVVIHVPERLSRKQKELLKEFEAESEKRGFFF